MPVKSAAVRHLVAGMRLEYSRQVQPPLLGLVVALLTGLGAALGSRESFTDPFAPLSLAMLLTLPTALWSCLAAAAASSPGARELLVARGADEWAIHLARVTLIGLIGGFLSLLFTLSGLLPHAAGLPTWLPALRWVPHLLLSHTAAAALGGTAGLLLSRIPAAGLLAAGGLWCLVVWSAAPLGPASPDPLLRVLQWNSLLQDGAAEPLHGALAISFLALALVAMLTGLAGFTLLQRTHLAPTAPSPARAAAWACITLVAIAAAAGAGWRIRAAEAALTALPPLSGTTQLTWQPDQRSLLATGPTGDKLIRGPVRPTAVALSEQRFQPYVGQHGAVVPLSLLTGAGPYRLTVTVPERWTLYGCGEASALPDGTFACRGERAEHDWLLLVPADAVGAASALVRTLSPQRAEARTLFEEVLAAGLMQLGEPMPDVVYIAPDGPRWLSPRLVAGPMRSAPDPAISRRQMAHAAARALAQRLSGEPTGGAERALLPILATLDRLVWELGLLPADLMSPASLNLPATDLDDYHRWWRLVDEGLTTGQVEAADLWQALGALQGPEDARRWPELASRLLATASEEG